MDEADDELRTLKVGFTASGEEQFRKLVAEKLRGFKRDVDHTLVVRFPSVIPYSLASGLSG